jgi:uncharacterized membrane protein
MTLIHHAAADVHPPLYYLLLKSWLASCGSSPTSLRGFSLLWGILSIPMLYRLCLEAHLYRATVFIDSSNVRQGALFSALLMAIHAGQVSCSRDARMYSIGVFLACFTSWLLLRALRYQRRSFWVAYGLSIAAFCYVHYFAFFCVIAHVIFVIGDLLVSARCSSFCQMWMIIKGFGGACILAILCYAPWIPIFFRQAEAVRTEYWVVPQTSESIFFVWSTGRDAFRGNESFIIASLMVAAFILLRSSGSRSAWFFFLQAAMPWLITFVLYHTTGRSLLVSRYLLFSQIALLGLGSVLWTSLPGLLTRLAVACLIVAFYAHNSILYLATLPDQPPALVYAAHYLNSHAQPSDVVIVDDPPSLNLLLYYTSQYSGTSLSFHCHASPFARHITHIASLNSTDVFLSSTELETSNLLRVWLAGEGRGRSLPSNLSFHTVIKRSFTGGGGTIYTLQLYSR